MVPAAQSLDGELPLIIGSSASSLPAFQRLSTRSAGANYEIVHSDHRDQRLIMTPYRSWFESPSSPSCTTFAPQKRASRCNSVPLGATCQTGPDRPVSAKVLVSAVPGIRLYRLPTRQGHSPSWTAKVLVIAFWAPPGLHLHHMCTTSDNDCGAPRRVVSSGLMVRRPSGLADQSSGGAPQLFGPSTRFGNR
jgi:hypothetical protein